MKKYKNALYSIGMYIAAPLFLFGVSFILEKMGIQIVDTVYITLMIIPAIILLIGIYFAFITSLKESPWLGIILMLMGIFVDAFFVWASLLFGI
jgi:hypothetical protein